MLHINVSFINVTIFLNDYYPGLVPPLVTTPFVTRDQGNAGPRFIRSSMYR